MEQSLARVYVLSKQLLDLGYVPYQLDSIIKETIGTTSLEAADQEQINQLIETLENYTQFAMKCLAVQSLNKTNL
jgi:methylphosphotriester-DNA--protein-cysteine methyltransferase